MIAVEDCSNHLPISAMKAPSRPLQIGEPVRERSKARAQARPSQNHPRQSYSQTRQR